MFLHYECHFCVPLFASVSNLTLTIIVYLAFCVNLFWKKDSKIRKKTEASEQVMNYAMCIWDSLSRPLPQAIYNLQNAEGLSISRFKVQVFYISWSIQAR
jgi:hypothetical protein